MFSQVITGMHKNCPNRLCRHPFDRSCHLGYLPKSELDTFAIMRCAKCGDTFMIVQILMMAHEYYKKLPARTAKKPSRDPITMKEVQAMRKNLDTDTLALSKLCEGIRPGGFTPQDE